MPWAKGQSGNPVGRKRNAPTFAAAIRSALSRKTPDGITYRHAIARQLAEAAAKGNLEAARILLERVDGKVPDALTVDQSGQLVIRVEYEDIAPPPAAAARGTGGSPGE